MKRVSDEIVASIAIKNKQNKGKKDEKIKVNKKSLLF